MTQAKITITRTRRGLGFPDTQRYVERAAAATPSWLPDAMEGPT